MLFKIKKLPCESERSLFWWGIVLTWSSLLYIGIPFAWGAEKSAEVNSAVQPHRWSAIRLSNVNRGATLEIKVNLDGQATVVLVNESQLKSYPRVARPLFRTETRNRAIFSIVAPKSDNYYLIVDNRKGANKRKFSLSVTAKLDLAKNPLQGQKRLAGNDPLKLLSRVIQTAFEGDSLKIKLTTCESSNTIIRGETIYLCQEYFKRLKDRFKDKREINQIILFESMKEAGYVLLRRWKYPLINSPNVKDEFATVLLLMFGRRESVEVQAKYSTWLEPGREGRPDTIRKWLGDPFFVKKWQPFLTPKMQTRYLRLLKKEGPPWASRKLIDRELIRRE
jgi:hypothetical protein